MSTNEQFVNVLTKPLSRVKFEYFHDKIGVVRILSLQGGIVMILQMMKIWALFENDQQVEDMEYHRKGRVGRRYEPSSSKGGSG